MCPEVSSSREKKERVRVCCKKNEWIKIRKTGQDPEADTEHAGGLHIYSDLVAGQNSPRMSWRM